MVVEIKEQINLMHSELFLWKGIMRYHYNCLESKNFRYSWEKHLVHISPYDYQCLLDVGVILLQWRDGFTIPMYRIENRIRKLKKAIKQANRILACINKINEITEDRNYWRMKCDFKCGALKCYPEFIRLQNERREKRLPI